MVISLAVEEGLFRGSCAPTGCGFGNVGLLPRLALLAPEPGFPWRGDFFPVGGASGSDR